MIFDITNPARDAVPAVLDSQAGGWLTYADLAAEVVRRQAALAGSRTLFFCFCSNRLASLAWYLAALDSGLPVALLDVGLAFEFRRRLLSLYTPGWVASEGPEAPDSAYVPAGVPGLWRRQPAEEFPLHPSLALLLSTSGSTGSPKFVRLTRANVEANAHSIASALEIAASDRAITSLPMHYSYGLSVINTHLLRGASLVLTDEGLVSPRFWAACRSAHCTSLAGVPYTYQMLKRLDLDKLQVPSLQVLTQAGGKLAPELIAHFHSVMQHRDGRFYVMYGQTEATARISILPPHRLPEKLGSAGLPIAGGRLSVAEDTGELIYRGPNVMLGYASCRDDLAKGDELLGVLATGDTASLDEEGFVYIQGRNKRDAKLFGLRVNMDEIEALLKAHGPTAVLSHNGRLVIFCDYPDSLDLIQIRHGLAQQLRVHQSAFEFRRVDPFPVTPSGKTDYSALSAQL